MHHYAHYANILTLLDVYLPDFWMSLSHAYKLTSSIVLVIGYHRFKWEKFPIVLKLCPSHPFTNALIVRCAHQTLFLRICEHQKQGRSNGYCHTLGGGISDFDHNIYPCILRKKILLDLQTSQITSTFWITSLFRYEFCKIQNSIEYNEPFILFDHVCTG